MLTAPIMITNIPYKGSGPALIEQVAELIRRIGIRQE